MGTRCTTLVKDERDNTLVRMYRQFDGYPEGHGDELAAFLRPFSITNGISGKPQNTANGFDCLAAQIVAHFKTDPGGIYLMPIDGGSAGEEYIYILKPKNGQIWLTVKSGCVTMFGNPGDDADDMRTIYDGFAEDFHGESIAA